MKQKTNRTENAINTRQFQTVIITFDDGSVASFTGPACVFPGEELRVTKVRFTEPREFGPDYAGFEAISVDE